MVGVCYLVTNSMEYAAESIHETRRFRITYEYGVYTITAAGNVFCHILFIYFFCIIVILIGDDK